MKAIQRAAERTTDSTLKAAEQVMPRSDSTTAQKTHERSSNVRTLERETAPHAPKNAG